jgi:3-oxoisoapionate decarboxylase
MPYPPKSVATNPDRRTFLATAVGTALAGGATAALGSPAAQAVAAEAARPAASAAQAARRVGAVAYSCQYGIGLFSYKDRPGARMDAAQFLDAVQRAGGGVAQLFCSMIEKCDDEALAKLRARAAELDLLLEIHGGVAFAPQFERTLRQAAALGAKVVGCSFGMLLRPDKIGTLAAWDEHLEKCRDRLRALAATARSLNLIVAVENHLDFTVEELRDLIVSINSPHVGVLFDVGNSVGTLDDPTEAADLLGPLTVATHYKDFAIEEVARGFRFTMVPLGCGSLRLGELTARLVKHVRPETAFSIEMMNGQQFEVCWLEDRFWTAYRHKTARQVAATLRHIRGKRIDMAEFKPQQEVDTLPYEAHMKLEADRLRGCIAYLKGILADLEQSKVPV